MPDNKLDEIRICVSCALCIGLPPYSLSLANVFTR